LKRYLLAAALACGSAPAFGQDGDDVMPDAYWMAWVPSEDSIEMPELAFEERQSDIDNYEKYYYFHRTETDFETALADIRECDAHARGLFRGNSSVDMGPAMIQYGVLGGAVGGILGAAIGDAIYGSAEIRRKRRINMRRCMFFKGYSRYGLEKDLWKEFNFEEGSTTVLEEDRQMMLAQQALVASGPQPQAEELGL
jgi:hypothetical protein